jgi:electron transfer flavoprotein alpha subunit
MNDMAGIWVFSENGVIARQLLTLGRDLANQLNFQLSALTLNAEESSSLIASGADKVFILQGENTWPESYAHPIAELAAQEQPLVLFIGGTQRGKDLAAKVAAHLKAGLVTDAFNVRLEGRSIETDRMIYGGLAVCTEVLSAPSLVTIPPRSYEEPKPDPCRSGEIFKLAVNPDNGIGINNVCSVRRTGANIETAEIVVCVGRGFAKQEDLRLAEDLAASLGAEIGCTRGVAEDYRWLPIERYIGLSGQKIKASLYISLGVSGQVQHIAGIRNSRIIVAINRDENAPIFDAADYGIVGDLYEVTPLLVEAIKNAAR